jgi:hypothetical protein
MLNNVSVREFRFLGLLSTFRQPEKAHAEHVIPKLPEGHSRSLSNVRHLFTALTGRDPMPG